MSHSPYTPKVTSSLARATNHAAAGSIVPVTSMDNSSKSKQTESSFDVRLCGSLGGSAGRVGVLLSWFEAEELIFLDIGRPLFLICDRRIMLTRLVPAIVQFCENRLRTNT